MRTVWTVAGAQGDVWMNARVPLSSEKTFDVVLEGVVGSGPQGDISIDDIEFNTLDCASEFVLSVLP